jgi:choice-of-anchor B domain-containing protein
VRVPKRVIGLAVLAIVTGFVVAVPASAHDPETPEGQAAIEEFMADHLPAERRDPVVGALVPCQNGNAAGFPCHDVDLQSVLPLSSIGGGNGNSLWGWTDTTTGREYAIMGRSNGTAFVDITAPAEPRYLGNLPSHIGASSWRDMRVYRDHVFVIADAISGHGMQVFDLTRLRNVTNPQTFTEDAHYAGFGPAHTLAINEETGFAYAVGSNTCSGGPHMVDIQAPKQPVGAGCVSQDGYTHETQCVVYRGPDTRFTGRELCFSSNEDTLTIVDVTNKSAPVQLARQSYNGARYTHQGWLTENQRYFLLDDELDEANSSDQRARTLIWDLVNITAPAHIGTYVSPVVSIDHNQYVVGNRVYQANYQAGLRILDITDIASGQLTEVGFFDIFPASNNAAFNGAWNVYPFFASGNVIISGIEQGLIVVRPNIGSTPPPPGRSFRNDTNVPIADMTTVESSIQVTGVPGNAPARLQVGVDVKHSYRGDLVVDLIAPDGSAYNLHNRTGGSADNLIQTYTVDASGEMANGTWKLRVRDAARLDTGFVDSWSLQF